MIPTPHLTFPLHFETKAFSSEELSGMPLRPMMSGSIPSLTSSPVSGAEAYWQQKKRESYAESLILRNSEGNRFHEVDNEYTQKSSSAGSSGLKSVPYDGSPSEDGVELEYSSVIDVDGEARVVGARRVPRSEHWTFPGQNEEGEKDRTPRRSQSHTGGYESHHKRGHGPRRASVDPAEVYSRLALESPFSPKVDSLAPWKHYIPVLPTAFVDMRLGPRQWLSGAGARSEQRSELPFFTSSSNRVDPTTRGSEPSFSHNEDDFSQLEDLIRAEFARTEGLLRRGVEYDLVLTLELELGESPLQEGLTATVDILTPLAQGALAQLRRLYPTLGPAEAVRLFQQKQQQQQQQNMPGVLEELLGQPGFASGIGFTSIARCTRAVPNPWLPTPYLWLSRLVRIPFWLVGLAAPQPTHSVELYCFDGYVEGDEVSQRRPADQESFFTIRNRIFEHFNPSFSAAAQDAEHYRQDNARKARAPEKKTTPPAAGVRVILSDARARVLSGTVSFHSHLHGLAWLMTRFRTAVALLFTLFMALLGTLCLCGGSSLIKYKLGRGVGPGFAPFWDTSKADALVSDILERSTDPRLARFKSRFAAAAGRSASTEISDADNEARNRVRREMIRIALKSGLQPEESLMRDFVDDEEDSNTEEDENPEISSNISTVNGTPVDSPDVFASDSIDTTAEPKPSAINGYIPVLPVPKDN